jgi:signal transduction histidine kinase
LLRTYGVETSVPGLYYLTDVSGGLDYFMRVPVNLSDNWRDVTLFFELSSRPNVEVLGYPELLLEKPVGLQYSYNTASYAKYKKNQLILRSGDFPYALERDVYDLTENEFAFFQAEEFDHVLYNSKTGQTVLVSFPTIKFYNVIISFTYIFFFFLLQIVILLLIGNRFTRIIDFHFSIKNKIVFSMILILLISLIFVGGGTIMYTYNRFEKGQIDILSEKIQSVLVELEHKISGYYDIRDIQPDYINNLLVKFSNVFYTDINIYDIEGNLVSTSRKEIFERNLTGKKINAIAFRELVLNKKARIVHKEYIGKMEYYSAYIPLINSENKLMAYINLPYFSKEILLRKELLRVVVAVINIYAFLLVLSIFVAVYISNLVTEPLRMVQQRLQNIDLSRKNELIEYHRNDEIGELVVEYNRMLGELDKSALLLAKSERESAWREMARQIAHEINNPLTPMKLSIQLLNKSWENKDADFDERFQRLTKTLIEQIDSLSSIATAFSQFAAMPIARSEKVNVIERINRSVELFNECSFASLEMNLSQQTEVFVSADNERMLQVFNNLLKNAIQAIPAGEQGEVVVNLTQTGESVVVEIKDNGTGISPEMENQLFQPNFTTKTSGTGLGLAIVKNIVEEFGGAIWFKSEPGKGSSFFVSMPVYKDFERDV